MNQFISEVFSPINLEIFYQLTLALVLGMVIGVEREIAKKKAGLRTFALVSMGSAFFSIISIHALDYIEVSAAVSAAFDPTRIAAQIVTGIGFLGAGVIIFDSSKLRGVTTAAGLWVAAAIGMSVGFKFYAFAVYGTILSLFTFVVLWALEERLLDTLRSYRSDDLPGRFE